jgi:urocanate reductase
MSRKQKKVDVSRRDFIKKSATVGAGATALVGLSTQQSEAKQKWDRVADVIVLGAGAAGLPAAIEAADHKASVIIIEENFDIGGHLILSGGLLPLGGGTSLQKKHGIEDSPNQVYLDLTRPDTAQTRFNDRDIVRAFADNSAATFEFLEKNGVKFTDKPPQMYSSSKNGDTIARTIYVDSIPSGGLSVTINGAKGAGMARPLEASARAKGVEILLRHKMTSIVRETGGSGRVLGIKAKNLANGKDLNIRAGKAVIIATGGHNSNVNFRRIFDSRLTEEYYVVGTPFARQTADGQVAALSIGASLWGAYGPTNEADLQLFKPIRIGCLDGLIGWNPESPVFDRARATGLIVKNWQNVILVNQTGVRFCNEVNTSNLTASPAQWYDFIAAFMGNTVLDGGARRVGGPIWSIFDADAASREKWDLKPPVVDPELFFSADTLAELAGKIVHKYQLKPMPAGTLQEVVAKYNSFVDSGKDTDFGKPSPAYKIQKPPFYAAWSMPVLHDTTAGLRTNGKAQVMDLQGQVIPRLYAAGDSTGGIALHGMPRAFVFGRLAGINAAAETKI